MLIYVHTRPDIDLSLLHEALNELIKSGMTPVLTPPWLKNPQEILARVDAVVSVEGKPFEYEDELQIPIYDYPDLPEYSLTETKYPAQVKGFMEKIMQMYRVHLKKNEDYSPANIMGAGEIGIATRLWDKMARLMNLCGFDIEIKSSGYSEPKNAKHESVEDNAMDLSVYGIIFQLFREGKWAN